MDPPPTSFYVTWIASRLSYRLGPYVEDHNLGHSVTEGLFILDAERDLRRRPDLAFVSASRWPLDRLFPETGDLDVVPDLAVEVVSPNDLAHEVLAKVQEYFRYGVRLVWVIYPEDRVVYVYHSPTRVEVLTPENELDGGDLIPGFRFPVSKLFQPAPSPT